MFKEMQMRKTLIGAVAATAMAWPLATFATDWYVDANYGNDAWDGTTAAIPDQATIEAGGTIHGPRKTLHAMMGDECVVVGDTVKAAEGDYNEGGAEYGTEITTNRVQVKAGVTLLATGSRDRTFITGADGIGDTYTNGATRCVYFIPPPENVAYTNGIVKGFTLRNGRTANSSEDGGGSTGAGLLVECDFQNNGGARNRASAMNVGTALRCRFSSFAEGKTWITESSKIIDSLVAPNCVCYKTYAYNCTFSGNGYIRGTSRSYNCFFIGTGTTSRGQATNPDAGTGKAGHYYAYSRAEFNLEGCATNKATCRVVTAAESPYYETTLRPLPGSVLIDAGNLTYYAAATNGWPTAWLAECGKDYYGSARVVNGMIDIGCGEMQNGTGVYIDDSSDGLVVTGAAKGETRIADGTALDLTFSRTLTSDRLCLGVDVDGVFQSFGGTTGNVPYSVTIPAANGIDHVVSAVYETNQKDWYVNPAGDDTNKGYHKDCPRKTLVKAMELATAGSVVHAAAGIYDEGEVLLAGCSNRVALTKGVGLVADEWPLRETVIQGAADTTAEADNGNGPAAVRCVCVRANAYVRGFKLTGGRTALGSDSGAQGGGAYLDDDGALVDCEVTGVGSAYFGPAVTGGTVIRCRVHNIVCGSYSVHLATAVADSHIDDSCYKCSIVLNSTVSGQIRSSTVCRIFNTYAKYVRRASETSKDIYCTNSILSSAVSDAFNLNGDRIHYDPATCRFGVAFAANLDADCRPMDSSSPLVDAGSKALYDEWFPAKWKQFKNLDIDCGQRIYNGQIDVGCGEYDFRPDFAGLLGAKAVVSAMGPNVTTNAAAELVVPEGETINLAVQPRGGRVTVYELAYTPDGGERTVISEKSVETFFRTLEGACTVHSLSGSVGGILNIR